MCCKWLRFALEKEEEREARGGRDRLKPHLLPHSPPPPPPRHANFTGESDRILPSEEASSRDRDDPKKKQMALEQKYQRQSLSHSVACSCARGPVGDDD